MPSRVEALRAEALRCAEMARLVSFEPHRQILLEMADRCTAEAVAIEGAALSGKNGSPGPVGADRIPGRCGPAEP